LTWDIGTESPRAEALQDKLEEFMNYIDTNVAAIPKATNAWTMTGAHIGCSKCEPGCSINSYAKTSSAGIRSYEPLQIPFARPRSTRIGPLSHALHEARRGDHDRAYPAKAASGLRRVRNRLPQPQFMSVFLLI